MVMVLRDNEEEHNIGNQNNGGSFRLPGFYRSFPVHVPAPSCAIMFCTIPFCEAEACGPWPRSGFFLAERMSIGALDVCNIAEDIFNTFKLAVVFAFAVYSSA